MGSVVDGAAEGFLFSFPGLKESLHLTGFSLPINILKSTESLGWCVYFVLALPVVFSLVALFSWHNADADASLVPGCRRVGLTGRTNLPGKDDISESGPCTVRSLWIYPLKSCRGVELERGTVITTGMQFDRLFSLARWKPPSEKEKAEDPTNTGKWEFLSQRHTPILALIQTELWLPDPASTSYDPKHPAILSGGVLVRYHSFTLPLYPPSPQYYPLESFTIWKDSPLALNMSSHLPSSLSTYLGLPKTSLALFRASEAHLREVYRCAPRKESLGWQPVTGFADAYPLHIVNLASVMEVAGRIENEIPNFDVLRFRPNIIIDGMPAYEEDAWKRIRIGKEEYYVVCRTARCLLPNNDQETGEKHPVEPNKVLRSYRVIDKGVNCACFGMMMVPKTDRGEQVRVGDRVDVLETGAHFYIRQ